MPTIKRFEDLRAWQSARELVRMVYEDSERREFGRDFGLKDQIRRAAVSVMSNIAKRFNAGTDAEFVRFLGFARRSNSEFQSQAYTAMDLSYISSERFQSLYDKANLIERQINALIAYLAKSRHKVKEATAGYNLSDVIDPSGASYLPDLPDL